MKDTVSIVKNNEILVPDIKKAIVDIKTPPKYIKQRPGTGGKTFSYVELGYVIKVLNEKFQINGIPLWDFKVLEQKQEGTQLWVKGQLTIHLSDKITITKEQFGASEIKKTRDGRILSIGDDLKSASSDALKKCASMLGIASDVYWQGDNDEPNFARATTPQLKKIAVMCDKKGVDREKLKADYNVKSSLELTIQQASEIIENLEKLPDVIEAEIKEEVIKE
jgi:hypothetical protein